LNATDGWRYIFSLTRTPQGLNGKIWDDFVLDDETGKFAVAAMQPWYKDYMGWMNRMWNEGLIDPESFTQDYDTYLTKIANGRVAGNIDSYWEWFPTNQDLINSGQDELSLMAFDIYAAPGIRENRYIYNDIAQRTGFSVTIGCPDPILVTQFFNFITSEEGQIMVRWGIEGENYYIDEKGQRVFNQANLDELLLDELAYKKRSGVDYLAGSINEWMCWPAGSKASNGQNFDSQSGEDREAMFGPTERETLTAYGFTYFTDIFYDSSKLPIHPYGAYANMPGSDDDFIINAKTQFDQIFFPSLVRSIMVPQGEFNSGWETFMNEIEATNIHLYLEHLDKQLIERKILWGIE
jgi:putative aldouronate transport system substrate-binding protein